MTNHESQQIHSSTSDADTKRRNLRNPINAIQYFDTNPVFRKNPMKPSNHIVIAVLLIAAFSCKKKDPEPVVEDPPPVPPVAGPTYSGKDFAPNGVGNYWIYEVKELDVANAVVSSRTDSLDVANAIVSSRTDSVYVQDTLRLRGRRFSRLVGSPIASGSYADSADCIIDMYGALVLRLKSDNDTISRFQYSDSVTWYKTYTVMKQGPFTMTYGSKTFRNCVTCYTYYSGNFTPGCTNRTFYRTYCPGVGLVGFSYAYSISCNRYEATLLRYKLN
jgi:hypothetical protein